MDKKSEMFIWIIEFTQQKTPECKNLEADYIV